MELNKTIKEYIRRASNKIRAIQFLGKKCKNCGISNIHVLDFHHISDDKAGTVATLKNGSWPKLRKELDVCELLCANCHQERHFDLNEGALNNRASVNKKTFLEAIKKFECERCGYNKCYDSLDFHHINDNKKEFSLGHINKRFSSVGRLTKVVLEELNKCVVLCRNCHRIEHSTTERFEKYKDIIYHKVKNFWSRNTQQDILLVKTLYQQGKCRSEICREATISRSTLWLILKKLKEDKLVRVPNRFAKPCAPKGV